VLRCFSQKIVPEEDNLKEMMASEGNIIS